MDTTDTEPAGDVGRCRYGDHDARTDGKPCPAVWVDGRTCEPKPTTDTERCVHCGEALDPDHVRTCPRRGGTFGDRFCVEAAGADGRAFVPTTDTEPTLEGRALSVEQACIHPDHERMADGPSGCLQCRRISTQFRLALEQLRGRMVALPHETHTTLDALGAIDEAIKECG